MPRVGSSKENRAPDCSHRAMITFCWLPPERLRMRTPPDADESPFPRCSVQCPCAVVERKILGRVAHSWRTKCVPRPSRARARCLRRSSGIRRFRPPSRRRGCRICSAFTRIVPASLGSAPKMHRASSVLPEPTNPARAKDFTTVDSEIDVVQFSSDGYPFELNDCLPRVATPCTGCINSSASRRPAIMSISSSGLAVGSPAGHVTVRHATVTLSVIA